MTETRRQGSLVRRAGREESLGVMSDDGQHLLVRDRETDGVFWVLAADVEPITAGPLTSQWEGGTLNVHHDIHLRDVTALPTLDGQLLSVGDQVATRGGSPVKHLILYDGVGSVRGFSSASGSIWVLVDQPEHHSSTSIPLAQAHRVG